MRFPHITFHCRQRLFEWAMTCAMLFLALECAIWPGTIGASAFRYMLHVIGPTNISLFFFAAGTLRIAALVANGSWPVYGPLMRAAGAGMAALIWFQMDIALFLLAPHNNGIPSPGIPVYFAITIGEIVSAYRAMTDAASDRPR